MRFPARRAPISAPGRDLRRLQSATELAADPLRADEVIRADTKIGPVFVHAGDEVMTPFIIGHREWEPDEAAWIEGALAPGATMLDVGANIGYFSLLASQVVGPTGHVIAVEPERRNLRVLRHNLWATDNTQVLPFAAWHEPTSLELRFNDSNAGDHQVHPVGSEPSTGVMVPALPLDELLADRQIDAIKIDTQGADHHVIRGLSRTLDRNPQALLLVEFWLDSMDDRGDRGADVLAGYRALGRPIGLLGTGGTSTQASDDEILSSAEAAPGRFVNLIIEQA